MKKIVVVFTALLLLLPHGSIAGQRTIDVEKVTITYNPDDVKGLVRLEKVSAGRFGLYKDRADLREEATRKVKYAAAELGATIVLIYIDKPVERLDYFMKKDKHGQFTSVELEGVAYAQTKMPKIGFFDGLIMFFIIIIIFALLLLPLLLKVNLLVGRIFLTVLIVFLLSVVTCIAVIHQTTLLNNAVDWLIHTKAWLWVKEQLITIVGFLILGGIFSQVRYKRPWEY